MKLITALAKFYDLEENAFAFGEKNGSKFYVDIGLEDILYSTGLPIDGLQVSGYEAEDPLPTIYKHLGVKAEEAQSLLYQRKGQSSSTIDLKKLRSRFEKVPDNETNLMPYRTAYLFYLVGCLLFAKSTEGISPMYLPLLGESVNKYAWGAATFAFIKKCLVSMKEEHNKNSASCFVYSLMIFALERFPCLREALGINSLPSGFPLLSGWLNLFPKGNDVNSVGHFRTKLENLTEDQVTWQPYKDRNLELPDEYKDHISMIYSFTACICFNVVSYTCPHKCFKQLGLAEVHMPTEVPNIKIHPKLSLSKNKDKDWRTMGSYDTVNQYWDKRHDYVVNAGQVELSGQIHNDRNQMNLGAPSPTSLAGDQSISGRERVEASNSDQDIHSILVPELDEGPLLADVVEDMTNVDPVVTTEKDSICWEDLYKRHQSDRAVEKRVKPASEKKGKCTKNPLPAQLEEEQNVSPIHDQDDMHSNLLPATLEEEQNVSHDANATNVQTQDAAETQDSYLNEVTEHLSSPVTYETHFQNGDQAHNDEMTYDGEEEEEAGEEEAIKEEKAEQRKSVRTVKLKNLFSPSGKKPRKKKKKTTKRKTKKTLDTLETIPEK